jgi:hypothetical protein
MLLEEGDEEEEEEEVSSVNQKDRRASACDAPCRDTASAMPAT